MRYLGDRNIVQPAKLIPWNCLLVAGAGVCTVCSTDIRPILAGLALFGVGLGGTLSPSCDALLAYCSRAPSLASVSEPVVVTRALSLPGVRVFCRNFQKLQRKFEMFCNNWMGKRVDIR